VPAQDHSRCVVGQIIGKIRPTLCQVRADRHRQRSHRKWKVIGGKTDLCSHAVGFPLSSTAAFKYIASHGVVIVKLHVVFRVHTTFTGRPSFFRQNCSLRDIIRFGLSPESAAQQCDVANHIFFRNAEFGGDNCLRRLRIPGWRPGSDFSFFGIPPSATMGPLARGPAAERSSLPQTRSR